MINKFAEILEELIKENGITKYKLAKDTNISKSVLTDYTKKRSQPTADIIITIALYFNVTTDYLLGLENEDGSKNIINGSFNNNSGTIDFKG